MAVLIGGAFGDENWPQFRGAEQTGVASAANLPETWSETESAAGRQEAASGNIV